MRVVDLKEMNFIEKQSELEFGFTEDLVIENVGIRGADVIYEKYLKHKSFGEIVILVGKGNNGADGLAIARNLTHYGLAVRAFMLFNAQEYSPELNTQLNIAQKYGVKVSDCEQHEQLEAYFTQTQYEYFVIDAIFGTGVRLPLPSHLNSVIKLANRYATQMVSIDIPSGVMGEIGTFAGAAIKATTTLAIGLPKIGHYVADGPRFIGDLVVLDVGFPQKLLAGGDKTLLTPWSVSQVIIDRNQFAHKNTFGHSLVIGGSHGLMGALLLASKSALCSGCGLVTAITWDQNYIELASRVPDEIMTASIPEDEDKARKLLQKLEKFDSVIIGPGLGKSEYARKVVIEVLSHYPGPVVIDADALNVLNLNEDAHLLKARTAPTLLTPHLGEFARLKGLEINEVKEKPIQFLKETMEQTNCSIILKGPCTYLGFPNGDIFLNYYPNEGLATGGSGDVLAGLIGGLFAQRSHLEDSEHPDVGIYYQAACLGAVVHSLAGKFAAKSLGARSMSAGSLTRFYKEAFEELEKFEMD